MPLRRPFDAVGPVQAGVEPLRRVRGRHLRRQHVADLVVEGAGVGLGREVAALPAPVGPAAGQPAEHLAGVGFLAVARIAGDRACCAAATPARPPRRRVSAARGTPALRKYFCARMSTATCDQRSGASRSFISKTTDPSGLTMREVRGTKAKAAKGSLPSAV